MSWPIICGLVIERQVRFVLRAKRQLMGDVLPVAIFGLSGRNAPENVSS